VECHDRVATPDVALRPDAGMASVLAEASRIFAEATLDQGSLLRAVAEGLVTWLGDTCIIRLLSEDGRSLLPAAVYPGSVEESLTLFDPAAGGGAQSLEELPSGQVVRTGVPLLVPKVDRAAFRAASKPLYWPYLDRYPLESLLITPLRARGKVLGTVSMARLRPGRPYTLDDQALLVELSDRAALAIDNARLFAALNEARASTQRQVDLHTAELQTANRELNGRLAELERAQAALRESENRFRLMAENARDIVYRLRFRPDFAFEYVSPVTTEITGYTPEEHYADPDLRFKIVHPEDRPLLELATSGGKGDGLPLVLRWIRKDGRVIWTEHHNHAIYAADGALVGVEGVARDITARKATEEALRLREAQLNEAQAIAHVGSWEWQIATNELTWSDELYRIHGRERAAFAVSTATVGPLAHPEDRQRLADAIQGALRGAGAPGASSLAIEYRIVRPNGEVRLIQARAHLFVDAQGKPVRMAGTAQDITERKQLEARLMVADRMASIGTLAGGVAHEINNPLGYVMANLEYVEEELRGVEAQCPVPLDDLKEVLAEARHGAERVRRIVRDLKTFSRVDAEERGPVQVQRVLELSVNMAWNELRHHARLVKDFAAVPPVEASESRLGQVFINLLINAAQSIPAGMVDRNEIRLVTKQDARGRVVVEVSDTGAGIAPEHLARVFEPFFTTKPAGVGTGLGLSICHGIISALGGQIAIDSAVGRGTTVRVTLPVAGAEVHAAVVAPPPAAPKAHRGRVLVIDDEPLICSAMKRALSGEHQVTAVHSPREALRLMRADPFEVILCDLMMPEMTGMSLHAELAGFDARQAERIIFLTGGAFVPAAREFLDRVGLPRMEKPVDLPALRAIIRTMLRQLTP
jgi:two-component system cell cycle sensor histidine kinase/response regulator CckA